MEVMWVNLKALTTAQARVPNYNIFRHTILYICNSIAKRVFSEIIMAAMINYF